VGSKATLVRARQSLAGEGLQVMVYAPDQPDLFARICSYFDQAGFSILDARVHTALNRYALDTFQVVATDAPQSYRELINLVESELTRVLVAASVTEGVPRWRKGSGLGWVTAEYAMLPRATHDRSDRESVRGRIGGRTHEISRLIGRSLRAIIDTKALGENTIVIDCDVLQADGGTRTASITGAYVALAEAIEWARTHGHIAKKAEPLTDSVAAVSVGIVGGVPLSDLAYVEDSIAETDMNVVVTGRGGFVEVQGTAEGAPFSRDELNALLDLALHSTGELRELQQAALSGVTPASA